MENIFIVNNDKLYIDDYLIKSGYAEDFNFMLHNEDKVFHATKTIKETRKTIYLTNDLSFFNDQRFIYESHRGKKPYFIKFINLSEIADFSSAMLKVTVTTKYKTVKSVSLMSQLTRHIQYAAESINDVSFDEHTLEAFAATYHNIDFFRFKEKCNEYRLKISLVKDKKVVGNINTNVGDFVVIYTPILPQTQETNESIERQAQRASALNPVYRMKNCDYVAEFNDTNKRYVDLVNDFKLVKEMIDI